MSFKLRRLACIAACVGLAPLSTSLARTPAAADDLGLYPATSFVPGNAQEGVRPQLRQPAWYFRDEWVAVPKSGLPQAGFEPGVHAFDDVRHWAAQRTTDAPIDLPPLVWLAAPQLIRHAKLADGGRQLVTGQRTSKLELVPKIALNRSYADASSMAWFGERDVALRGTFVEGRFVARTLWPEDFVLGPAPPPSRALPTADPADALRTLMREAPQGGATSPYAATTLWQREPTAVDWAGKPVIGLMVNGAQGDDDEAHGGHFAIVTGRVQSDGSIGNWLVNNFYSLDVESEKGILAAPLPLDNYLGDLNSGQNWYRPTSMVVAVLDDEPAAALVQSALNRVFNQFYRHQLVYYHPNQNCASISVDTLRALGWQVPPRGPSSRALAWAAYPVVAVKDLSIGKARLAFDYLRTDQTRLLPAAALEQAFASLWSLAQQGPVQAQDRLATMLAQDLRALVFVRMPQFPSSRAFGGAPAVSVWEYRTLVPNDPALAQIVPVPPRPFPDALRDADLLPRSRTPADYATWAWGAVVFVVVPLLAAWWWRRRRLKRGAVLQRAAATR